MSSSPLSSDHKAAQQQRAAKEHIGRPARLLAGPGTGKTWTLTERVIWLTKDQEVLPTQILAFTFTRAAAQELRARIRAALGEGQPSPYTSTLHSYALRQLLKNNQRADIKTPLRIADDWEERHIIQEDVRRRLRLAGLTGTTVKDVRDLLQELSADWETLAADEEHWQENYPNPEFLAAWQGHRDLYGYTLRSELVYQLKRSLYTDAAFRLELMPDHVLVDEYQDLNRCEVAVVDWLRMHGAEVFVAGDDDQSIYSFRNAYPLGIREFTTQVKGSADLRLEVCKRCDTEILRVADFVIRQDLRRVTKILSAEDGRPAGIVRFVQFPNQYLEAKAIAEKVRGLIDEGLPAGEILILLRQDRNHAFSRVLAQAMAERQVPVHVDVGESTPLDDKGGRQLLALLRIALDSGDSLSWRTLIALDRNALGGAAAGQIEAAAAARDLQFGGAVLANQDQAMLGPWTDRVRTHASGVVVDSALLAARLDTTSIDPDSRAHAFLEKLSALSRPSRVASRDEWSAAIAYLVSVGKATETTDLTTLLRSLGASREDEEQVVDPAKVNILSMHKAKGLGSDTVFVVAAEDEYLPGRASDPAEVDDERRLLYVSLTRARRRLFVTHCSNRFDAQTHSGRTSGRSARSLTRFLKNAPARYFSRSL